MNKKLQIIKQALNGESHDYTLGSIQLNVILLAIPMILELSLESIFALVDMYFVSKLGGSAIATVGLTESVITIIYSIAIGLCTGASAVVARRVGEKNLSDASKSAAQSIILGIFCSLIIAILGFILAEDILLFMGAKKDVISIGLPFTKIMIGSAPIITFLFLANGIFRGAGNAAISMKSLWIASLANIILCPIFIHWLGLTGAAIATVIGRSVGVIYQVHAFKKQDGLIKFQLAYFFPNFSLLKNILNIAYPAALQFIISSGSWIIIIKLISEFGGTEASAGYQIAFRYFIFFILPAWGISNAAATLVGQNIGANQPDRAFQSSMIATKYNIILMFFVMVIFMIFPRQMMSFFTTDQNILDHGMTGLRIIGSGFIFYGIAMVMTQSLNGAGDSKSPTKINFFCFWIFQTPLAYLLCQILNLGPKGAMAALPIAQLVLAIWTWKVFQKRSWQNIKC